MGNKLEKRILYGLTIFGLMGLPTLFIKKPVKNWIIAFFIKVCFNILNDSIVRVKLKRITYPVRLFPTIFRINILYDLLLFPLTCVWYNQWTHHSSIKGILIKVLAFSVPMTLIEGAAERYTKLLKYKNWSQWHSFLSISCSFILIRSIVGFINWIDRKLKDDG
ncbi:MAG TPA: CBO0543 family protein [Chondromyces sp.]|nr:CBO0543 family protein [Chondromyces sp.]